MTLLEAMVALAIAFGAVVAALNASSLAAQRTTLVTMDMEAALKAESLIEAAGSDLPLKPGRAEGADDRFARWTIEIHPEQFGRGVAEPFAITSTVTIDRGGKSVQYTLSTLRLQWRAAP